jgi:formate hydrogenlyase transcriptional activator
MSEPPADPAAGPPTTTAGLVRQRELLSLVLEVSRAAASLDLSDLIERVGQCIERSNWRWDYTSVCLYDPREHALRQHHLLVPPALVERYRQYVGALIPIEGSQSGKAFTTGEASLANSREEYLSLCNASWRQAVEKAIPPAYSCGAFPLRSGGRRLGVLVLATPRDRAFDPDSVSFLGQIADALAPAVDNALVHQQIQQLTQRLSQQNTYLEAELGAQAGEIVGDSPALREVMAHVASVAPTTSTVLIQGETGTGKELIARAIHRQSARRQGSFVKVNCAALPIGLLESELFGHERGAFTGAVGPKPGRFELAEGGTLFLDEVGELPLEMQPKLLRVLQEQELERVGGIRTIRVDVRVVAATNRNLAEMIAQRSFRSDLYYRLNVFPIFLPPLRQRPEDLIALVQHFVARTARRLNKPIDGVAPDSLARLTRYPWPGNIRELENVIERAIILSRGGMLHVHTAELEAGPAPGKPSEPVAAAAPTLAEAERAFILQALEQRRWVVGGKHGAASDLGLHRTTLQARMRKLGITRPGRPAG